MLNYSQDISFLYIILKQKNKANGWRQGFVRSLYMNVGEEKVKIN